MRTGGTMGSHTGGGHTGSAMWFGRARRVLPGGVNSPVRAFNAVGGTPRVIASAWGAMLRDVDGHEYVDYIGSWGATVAGHAHPDVVRAVSGQAARGSSFGTCSTPEVLLAERVVARVRGVEKVRFVNSGTEAILSVIRLARAATARGKLLKFAGCYHGHADALLVKAGSGVVTLGLPDSPGVPASTTADTLIARFNDRDGVASLLQQHGTDVAAILVEPVVGNMGLVPPDQGFVAFLREQATRHGALLVFDEVMTGFRLGPGGVSMMSGVTPDLWAFGKVIGGGLPVGAYGGRHGLMDQIAPSGPVYQAGTLSGNPLAMAAGLATLDLLTNDAYARLERVSARLGEGLRDILGSKGCVQRVGSMLTVFFGVDRVRHFDDATSADHAAFGRFFHAMLDHGVHLPPSGYEAWFVSLAHDEAIVDRTLRAAESAMRTV